MLCFVGRSKLAELPSDLVRGRDVFRMTVLLTLRPCSVYMSLAIWAGCKLVHRTVSSIGSPTV
jgi:hypothetical protein